MLLINGDCAISRRVSEQAATRAQRIWFGVTQGADWTAELIHLRPGGSRYRLGIDVENNDELRNLYTYDGSSQFFDNYRAWDDARFTTTFGTGPVGTSPCRELIARLRERRLLKRVFTSTL